MPYTFELTRLSPMPSSSVPSTTCASSPTRTPTHSTSTTAHGGLLYLGSRKAPAQRMKDQTHRGASTSLGCPIYRAHHHVSLSHRETKRWYYSNLSILLGTKRGTALHYILHLFDCRVQATPNIPSPY
jgi:hypothetical protein